MIGKRKRFTSSTGGKHEQLADGTSCKLRIGNAGELIPTSPPIGRNGIARLPFCRLNGRSWPNFARSSGFRLRARFPRRLTKSPVILTLVCGEETCGCYFGLTHYLS